MRAGSVLNTAAEWLALVARWMAPMMPGKAQALWSMLGRAGRVVDAGWPVAPSAGAWRESPGGAPLAEIEGLFGKLTEEQVQAEIAALEAR